MRFAFALTLWAAAAGAQAPQMRVPPAPPTPPPVVIREAEPVRQKMQGAGVLALPQYSIGQPTDEEQYYLELINRARANPAAEGLRLAATTDADILAAYDHYGVDLNMLILEFAALPVRPPLAMNEKLLNAARAHSQDMFTHAFQGHDSSNGDDLGDRATTAGYSYLGLAENVYSFAQSVTNGHAGFEVDWGADIDGSLGGMQSHRGHRMNIHRDLREVGIGVVNGVKTVGQTTVGPQLVTQDFGTGPADAPFVTGVAYYDLNGNGFYDPGEGIGGLSVTVNGASFEGVTANSGGYAVPVPKGAATRAVTFSGLGISEGGSAVITAADNNAKVDLVAAYVAPVVTGPLAPASGNGSVYNFTSVGGAEGYQWRRANFTPAPADGADNLNRVSAVKTGEYAVQSGSSYRLAHETPPVEQSLTYNAVFRVGNGASVNFQSRLGWAGGGEVAQVQVSTDEGATWTSVYSQTGSNGSGEASFVARSASLAAFSGQEVKLRFVYSFAQGTYYPAAAGTGWFIDSITFNNLDEVRDAVVSEVSEETSFIFTPPAEGPFSLSVRPIVGGRAFPYGEPLNVVSLLGPEITLERTPGGALIDGAGSVNYGSVPLGVAAEQTFTIRNDGAEDLTGLAAAIEGAADFATSQPGLATLPPGQSTTFTVTITPSAAGTRTAVLRVASNDGDENPFDVNLRGIGDGTPIITGPAPVAEIRQVGGADVTFAVTATPDPLTYQWRRNGVAISGATSTSLTIDGPMTLAHAGAYSVLVKRGALSATSAAAQLAVVEDAPKTVVAAAGGKVTLKVTAAGNGLTYLWKRLGGDLPPELRLAGAAGKKTTTNTLVIQKLDAATDSGIYFCEVTGPGGTVTGGTTEVRVFGNPPIITAFAPLPGIVGGWYSCPVETDEAADVAATSFAATGLPPGLKLDSKTGIISGRPTKAGSYLIKVTASNSKGKSAIEEATVVIADFPVDLAGTYAGWVERSGINGNLGGRIDLKVTGTGSFSGSLIMGTTKHALKGALEVDRLEVQPPRAEVSIKRAGKPAPEPLEMVLEIDGNALTAASKVSAEGQEAAITGWRQVWDAKNKPADRYTGYYTGLMRLSGVVAEAPAGSGYMTFSVGKDGRMKLAGTTADGEKVTSAGFIGPAGEAALFQVLYGTGVKGSLLGQLQIGVGDDADDPDDNPLNGDLDWVRPANDTPKARTYKLGFGNDTPVPLTVTGGRYTGDAAAPLLGLTEGMAARLAFAGGGLAESRRVPDVILEVGVKNKAIIPPLGLENEAAVKLKATGTTGLFSGTFVLDDPDPRNPAVILKRTVKYQGVMIWDGTEHYGEGSFMLPQLPQEGSTPAGTAILSGGVVLEKEP